jgi:hypothetical protein
MQEERSPKKMLRRPYWPTAVVLKYSTLLCCLSVLLIATFTVGCEGGNCPFNRPACCDNALFGCGPFDLPEGCSCNDYLQRSFSGKSIKLNSQSPRSQAILQNSTWRVQLRKEDDNCPYLGRSIQRTVTIRRQGRRAEINLFGYSKLRGIVSNKEIRVRGVHRLNFPRCDVSLTALISEMSSTKGTATGRVAIRCQQQPALSCSTNFSGVAQRL